MKTPCVCGSIGARTLPCKHVTSWSLETYKVLLSFRGGKGNLYGVMKAKGSLN